MVSAWKTFRFAAWLGWQAESNWADPYLFAIYSVIRPVSSVLVTVFMYLFVLGLGAGQTDPRTQSWFQLMYIGSVLYMYVFQVLFGLSWIIMEDREHYKTLKYWYITPSNLYIYLFGRGVSRIVVTTIATFIVLLVGWLVFGITFNIDPWRLPFFFAATFLGLFGLLGFGIILAGISLVVARHNQFLGESIGGVFYLLSGVLFPISVLPSWLHGASLSLPITYWIEAGKRSLLGYGDPVLQGFSDTTILFILLVSTAAFLALSHLVFKLCDHHARMNGYIDRTTWF
ncbi:MAG TPA: ABC transporter permease [Thermoplasmata archaeon]|nr:ABC transporter permease [Thermoplasmata archaeon]